MNPDKVDGSLHGDKLKSWLGRQQVRIDEVSPAPARAMSAMLDRQAPEELEKFPLPALWHWLYFLSLTATSSLAVDGHAKKGEFLPPVPLSLRMWAGGQLEFLAPLKVGDTVKRVSTIADITHKTGCSGELVFVSVNHDFYNGELCLLRERQDLVYRDKPKSDAPPPQQMSPPALALWSISVEPSPTLLFRYSALTFNAHRIHYDRDYATTVDGYEDLVVHGPLVATLLLDLLLKKCPTAVVNRFDYRGVRPLLANAAFKVEGCFAGAETGEQVLEAGRKSVLLWAKNTDGWVTMTAKALVTIC
jgi:3-methylfumaryl-CoA hydratase